MLLPRDPELEKMSPEDDPRKELVDRLLEHERFKSAAEMLQQKRVIEEAVWSNPQIERFLARTTGSGAGCHALRPGEDLPGRPGAGQAPAGLRSRRRRRHHART